MLVHVPELFRHVVLGQTLDDAAGEAFDKVARLLGSGSRRAGARRGGAHGDPDADPVPASHGGSGDLDFSLSGLKTAVLRYVRAEQAAGATIDVPDSGGIVPGGDRRRAGVEDDRGARARAVAHRAARRRRRREHPPARTVAPRRRTGGPRDAVPAPRALHRQRRR
jgi:hypothetical protein